MDLKSLVIGNFIIKTVYFLFNVTKLNFIFSVTYIVMDSFDELKMRKNKSIEIGIRLYFKRIIMTTLLLAQRIFIKKTNLYFFLMQHTKSQRSRTNFISP